VPALLRALAGALGRAQSRRWLPPTRAVGTSWECWDRAGLLWETAGEVCPPWSLVSVRHMEVVGRQPSGNGKVSASQASDPVARAESADWMHGKIQSWQEKALFCGKKLMCVTYFFGLEGFVCVFFQKAFLV